MKNLSVFQLVMGGIFLFLAAAGLIAFINFSGSNSTDSVNLVIWTDLEAQELWSYVEDQELPVGTATIEVIDSEVFVDEVINRISLRQVPDVLITTSVNQRLLGQRLRTIPDESLPPSQFQQQYVTGTIEAFRNIENTGFYGIPLAVDPLILYANQDLLDQNGVATKPIYWDEMSSLVNQYARRSGRQVVQTVLPIGLAENVETGHEVLYTLLGQIGKSPITYSNGVKKTDLRDSEVSQIVNYYTDFADFNTGVYNWSTRQTSARQTFAEGDAYFHIDFASQAGLIQDLNPNQLVTVSELPQIRGNQKHVYANYYGAFFPAESNNVSASIEFIGNVAIDPIFTELLIESGNLISANRSQLDTASPNPLQKITSLSALSSGTVLIADQDKADQAFSELINDILFRGIEINRATREYADKIENL